MNVTGMHADEVPTDADLVARLVADQFPRWADLAISPVPSSGTDNAMFRLGPELAVRLPRIHWATDAVTIEHTWLPRLEPQLPLPVPVPIGLGRPTAGFPWPWTVCRWLDGIHPEMGAPLAERALADDLAGFITALRAVDPADGPAAKRGVPLAERDKPTRKAIGLLEGVIDTERVIAAWDRALAAPPWSGPPAWVHGDLTSLNLLCSTDGILTGVLDFGLVGVGDPACDAFPAWNTFGQLGRQRFRDRLDVDDATWERGRGWALSVALIQLPYYRHSNPGLTAISHQVIGQILGEDDPT